MKNTAREGNTQQMNMMFNLQNILKQKNNKNKTTPSDGLYEEDHCGGANE